MKRLISLWTILAGAFLATSEMWKVMRRVSKEMKVVKMDFDAATAALQADCTKKYLTLTKRCFIFIKYGPTFTKDNRINIVIGQLKKGENHDIDCKKIDHSHILFSLDMDIEKFRHLFNGLKTFQDSLPIAKNAIACDGIMVFQPLVSCNVEQQIFDDIKHHIGHLPKDSERVIPFYSVSKANICGNCISMVSYTKSQGDGHYCDNLNSENYNVAVDPNKGSLLPCGCTCFQVVPEKKIDLQFVVKDGHFFDTDLNIPGDEKGYRYVGGDIVTIDNLNEYRVYESRLNEHADPIPVHPKVRSES